MAFLEGNEFEKEYDGGAGKVVIDVDDKGGIKFSNVYVKDVEGLAKVKSDTSVETDIFVLAEAIAKKTKTELDDKAIAGIKAILGISKVVAPPVEEPAG